MAERNTGDAAKNELKLKNPLLCSTVTGLSMDEFIHKAVLMPVATASASGDPYQDVATHAKNPSRNESNPENLKTHKTFLETQTQKPPDDDFDLAAYYARVHGTDPNLVKNDSTETFSDIDLDSKSPDDDDDQESVASQTVPSGSMAMDLAQNLSQLPQVLPQVASAVLGSFSNVLNLTRSSPWMSGNQNDHFDTSKNVPDRGVDAADFTAFSMSRGEEMRAVDAVENIANLPPVPLFHTNDFGQVTDSEARSGIDMMGSVHGKGKQVSSSNLFRLGANRKKTYAQVPGLTLGETHPPPINFSKPSHVPPPTSNDPAIQTGFPPINTETIKPNLPDRQTILNPGQNDFPYISIESNQNAFPNRQNIIDPFNNMSTVQDIGKQSLNNENLQANLAKQIRCDSDPNNPYNRLRESPVGFSALRTNVAESNVMSINTENSSVQTSQINFTNTQLGSVSASQAEVNISQIDSKSETLDKSFDSIQDSTLFTSVTCPNYAYIPVGTVPLEKQENFGNIPYNEVTNTNVSYTNTTQLENVQQPLFFNPTSFVSSQNVFQRHDSVKNNIAAESNSNIPQIPSQSDVILPPVSSLSSSAVDSSSATPAFPPSITSIPPPASVSGNQFRLGSKKKPQYYSGPVEGAISLSQNKPAPVPGIFEATSTPEIFNPITGVQDNTSTAFSADLAFGASYPDNLGQVQTGYFKSSQQEFSGSLAQAGVVNQGFSSQDSQQNSGINFSLEKLQSAVNLSKIQNVVTSFFDPNYFADKKKMDSDTAPENETFSIETVQPESVSKIDKQNETPTYYYRSTNTHSSSGTSSQTIRLNQGYGQEKQTKSNQDGSSSIPNYARTGQNSATAPDFGETIQTQQFGGEQKSNNDVTSSSNEFVDSQQNSSFVNTDHSSVGAPLFFNPASCKPVDLTGNVTENKSQVFHDGSERLRKAPPNYFAKQKNIAAPVSNTVQHNFFNPGSVIPNANAVSDSGYGQTSSVVNDAQVQNLPTQVFSAPFNNIVQHNLFNPGSVIPGANVVSDSGYGQTSSVMNDAQVQILPTQMFSAPINNTVQHNLFNPGLVMPDTNAISDSGYGQISSVINDPEVQILPKETHSAPETNTSQYSLFNPGSVTSDSNVVSDLGWGNVMPSASRNDEQLQMTPTQAITAPLMSYQLNQVPILDVKPIEQTVSTQNTVIQNSFENLTSKTFPGGAASFFDQGLVQESSVQDGTSNLFSMQDKRQYFQSDDQKIAHAESVSPSAPPLCEVDSGVNVDSMTTFRASPSQLKNSCNPEDIQEYVIEPSPDDEEDFDFEASTSKQIFTRPSHENFDAINHSVFGTSDLSVSNILASEENKNILEMYSNEGCSSSGSGRGFFDNYGNAQSTSKSFFDDLRSKAQILPEDVGYVNRGFNEETGEEFDDNISMICNISAGLSSIAEDDLNSERDDQNSLGTDDEMEKDSFEMMDYPRDEVLHDSGVNRIKKDEFDGFNMETPSVTSETPSLVEEMRSYNLSNEQTKHNPENETKDSAEPSIMDSFQKIQLTSEPVIKESIEPNFSPDSMEQDDVNQCANVVPVQEITEQHLSAFVSVRNFSNENLVQSSFVSAENVDSGFVTNSEGPHFDSNNPIHSAAYFDNTITQITPDSSYNVCEDSNEDRRVIDSNVYTKENESSVNDSIQYQQTSVSADSAVNDSNLCSEESTNYVGSSIDLNVCQKDNELSNFGSMNLYPGAIDTNLYPKEIESSNRFDNEKSNKNESANIDLNEDLSAIASNQKESDSIDLECADFESNKDNESFDGHSNLNVNLFHKENDSNASLKSDNSECINVFGMSDESNVRFDSFKNDSSYSNDGFCVGDESSDLTEQKCELRKEYESNLLKNLQKDSILPPRFMASTTDINITSNSIVTNFNFPIDENPIPFFNPFAFGLVKAQPDFAALPTAENSKQSPPSCDDFDNLQSSFGSLPKIGSQIRHKSPFDTNPDSCQNAAASFFQNVPSNNEFNKKVLPTTTDNISKPSTFTDSSIMPTQPSSIPATDVFRMSTAIEPPPTTGPGQFTGDFKVIPTQELNTPKLPTTTINNAAIASQFSSVPSVNLFQTSSGAELPPFTDFGTKVSTIGGENKLTSANRSPVFLLKTASNTEPFSKGFEPYREVKLTQEFHTQAVAAIRNPQFFEQSPENRPSFGISSIPTSSVTNFPQRSCAYSPSFATSQPTKDLTHSLPPVLRAPFDILPIVQYPRGSSNVRQFSPVNLPPKTCYSPTIRSVSPLANRYPKVPSSFQEAPSNFYHYSQPVNNMQSSPCNPLQRVSPYLQMSAGHNYNQTTPANQMQFQDNSIPLEHMPLKFPPKTPNVSQYHTNLPPKNTTVANSGQYVGNLPPTGRLPSNFTHRQTTPTANNQTPLNVAQYQSNLPPYTAQYQSNFPPSSQVPQNPLQYQGNLTANNAMLPGFNHFQQPGNVTNQFPPHVFSMPSENNNVQSPSHFFS